MVTFGALTMFAVGAGAGLLTFCARRMNNLSSHGWARVGGIFCIAVTPFTFGLSLAIGVWVLMTLKRPEVEHSFMLWREMLGGQLKVPVRALDSPTIPHEKLNLLRYRMAGPSLVLKVIGGLLATAGTMMLMLMLSDPRDEIFGGLFVGGISAIVAAIIVLRAARAIDRMSDYSLAVTGAFLFLFVSPVTYFLAVPFALWVIRFLNNPIVRLAFAESRIMMLYESGE